MRTLDAVSCYIYRAMCACFWILWGKEDKDTSASNAKMLGPRPLNDLTGFGGLVKAQKPRTRCKSRWTWSQSSRTRGSEAMRKCQSSRLSLALWRLNSNWAANSGWKLHIPVPPKTMRTGVCEYVCACVYVYVKAYLRTHTHRHTHTHSHVCTCVLYIYTYASQYVCMCVCIYVCTICTYINIYTYTYIYMCVYV